MTIQKEIKKIELILENYVQIDIAGKYIGDLSIENIKRSIKRFSINSISDILTCEHFSISINRKFEHDENSRTSLASSFFNKQSPSKRLLARSDITSVVVYFFDGRREQFFVDWNDSNCENNNQHVYKNKFGDVFIVIDKDSNIEDTFNISKIEDKKRMKFIWKQLGVDSIS